MAETSGIEGTPTRRTVVMGVGAAGLAATLAACGSEDGSSDKAQTSGADSPSQGGQSSAPAGGGGTELAKAADIPQGGGKIFKDQKVVVTQPAAGQYKAF